MDSEPRAKTSDRGRQMRAAAFACMVAVTTAASDPVTGFAVTDTMRAVSGMVALADAPRGLDGVCGIRG